MGIKFSYGRMSERASTFHSLEENYNNLNGAWNAVTSPLTSTAIDYRVIQFVFRGIQRDWRYVALSLESFPGLQQVRKYDSFPYWRIIFSQYPHPGEPRKNIHRESFAFSSFLLWLCQSNALYCIGPSKPWTFHPKRSFFLTTTDHSASNWPHPPQPPGAIQWKTN